MRDTSEIIWGKGDNRMGTGERTNEFPTPNTDHVTFRYLSLEFAFDLRRGIKGGGGHGGQM